LPEFTNKVAIVTGAAGNLGRAVAEKYLAAGARLALLDHNADSLQEKYGEWVGHGRDEVMLVTGDLTDVDSVGQMVGKVTAGFGGIDFLANIAGGFRMGPLLQDTDLASWEHMLALNTRSVFLMCRAAIPIMLAGNGGRIINISARAAIQGKANMGPYCASKAAVITLTESIAAENRHRNILANAILPGTIDTPENRADMPDADFSHWVAPNALADVVVFLSSEASRAISGASIPVYGRS